MYVCIEAVLRRVPMEKGVQHGLGGGVQCPNPTGTIGPASRTLRLILAPQSAFCSQLYSGQLKVICILI